MSGAWEGAFFWRRKLQQQSDVSFQTTPQISSVLLSSFRDFQSCWATRPNWKHDASKFPGYSRSQKRVASAGIDTYILFSSRTVLGIRFGWAEHVERFETFVCFASFTHCRFESGMNHRDNDRYIQQLLNWGCIAQKHMLSRKIKNQEEEENLVHQWLRTKKATPAHQAGLCSTKTNNVPLAI